MSQTINVPANSIIYISTDGGMHVNSGTVSVASIVDIALVVDGFVPMLNPFGGGFRRVTVANTTTMLGYNQWSFAHVRDLTPGNHTIEVHARLSQGVSVIVSGDTFSPLQGQLTILTLKK